MDKQIYSFLKKLRRRLGFQKALDIFPLFLAIGCIPAFFNVCFGYFYPFYYADKIGIAWILLSFFIGTVYFFLHFPKETDAAHTGDRAIGHDRLLTALELRGNESAVSCLQKEDTIYHISGCNLKSAFPYRLSPYKIAAFLFAFLLFLFFLLLPSDAKTTAFQLHKVKQQAKEEINSLEELKKDITQAILNSSSDSSSLEEATLNDKLEELSSLLDDAKKEYASAQSEKDLTKASERLEAKLNHISAKAQTDKEWSEILSLAASAGLPIESTQNFSEDNNDSSLENTDNNQTDLNENNSNANNTNNTKTTSGNHTANTISSGSKENASSDSNSNSNNNNSSSSGNNNNSNGNDSSTTNSSSESNNNNSNNKNNSNSSKNNNSSSSENSSSNENNSENGENGNSQSGNGKNNSSGNGNGNGNGKNSGSGNGTGYNYGSKNGIERKSNTNQLSEQITIMEENIGKDENLTGNASNDGNSYTESGNTSLNSGVKKDFDEVISSYTQNAYSAIENNKIPREMTDVVKNYFTNLNS